MRPKGNQIGCFPSVIKPNAANHTHSKAASLETNAQAGL